MHGFEDQITTLLDYLVKINLDETLFPETINREGGFTFLSFPKQLKEMDCLVICRELGSLTPSTLCVCGHLSKDMMSEGE